MKLKYFLLLFIWLPIEGLAQTPGEFKNHAETLATFDGRKAGTDGCNKAAEYITETLESFGYKVESQDFTYRGYTTKNVVAVLGAGPEYIVVGAHYDGQGRGYPSADDNASGTAIVLELAKSFKKVPTWRSLAFILFSAEEDGLIGSQFYAKHPLLPHDNPDIKKHVFMVNLDMVGHLSESKSEAIDPHELLAPLFAKYTFARSITLRSHSQDSDNFSFTQQGVPALFIHTGLHNRYHTQRDTPDTLNYAGMVKIHTYVEEMIRTLSVADLDTRVTETLDVIKYKP